MRKQAKPGKVTEASFRRIALGMKDAVEGAHMGHPDFRVGGRIFSTIHHDRAHGMVKLTPEQQEAFLREHPGAFAPESGAWGRAGCTRVTFDQVDEETLGEALTLAWQNTVRASATKTAKSSPRRKPGPRSRA
jgi:hypothetical protein